MADIRGVYRPRVDGWLTAHVRAPRRRSSTTSSRQTGSDRTFRVTDAAERTWSLRRPPVRHAIATAHDMSRERRIMAALEGHDWELCTIGNSVADVAWSLQCWTDPGDAMSFLNDPPTLEPVFVRREEVARRYEKRSGFDVSDLPYDTVLSWWNTACTVEGVYARRWPTRPAAHGDGDPSDSDPAGRRDARPRCRARSRRHLSCG